MGLDTFDLLIQQAKLPDGSLAQVAVKDGCISAIAPLDQTLGTAKEVLDIQGNLLCPGLVDGHIHLDKTFWGTPWQSHIPGDTVRQRVEIEKQMLREIKTPVEERASHLIERAIQQGTTLIRTHVDIYPEVGLRNLEGVLNVRDRYRDFVDIQIVAFPQSGLLSCPGTLELLDAALFEGADLIGGLDPAGIDQDVNGHLHEIFRLAEKHGVSIDIHLHDPGHLGIYELEQIAQRTIATGMQGRVAVSHAYCLGMVSPDLADTTTERLATAAIAIMTNAPGHHPFPSISRLRQAGITVFSGSDDVRNAWCPFSNADMLERAMLIAYRSNFLTDADLMTAFEMITTGGATVLGVEKYGLQEGAIADFVVLAADSIPEAIATRSSRKYVIKHGHIRVVGK
ncbi:MAG: amidohydrolase family protein [Oculatellaceae cyanobacterium bins.114]|nr:amidohydrolase family protein [Oculatellaceae cyanobacterium bins.114]